MTPAPGTYPATPAADYFGWEALSSGYIRALAKSPAHGLAYVTEERKTTPAMARGTLAHSELEGAALANLIDSGSVVLKPEITDKDKRGHFGTKVGQAWRDEQLAAGRTIVEGADAAAALGIARSLEAVLGPLLTDARAAGQCEVSCVWREEGTLCKSRNDLVPLRDARMWLSVLNEETGEREMAHAPVGGALMDLKTCADPWRWGQTTLWRERYDLQGAHYRAGYNATNPQDPRKAFIFLAVESKPPFTVVPWVLGADVLDAAEEDRQRLLAVHRECSLTGEWTAPTQLLPASRPGWVGKEVGA